MGKGKAPAAIIIRLQKFGAKYRLLLGPFLLVPLFFGVESALSTIAG